MITLYGLDISTYCARVRIAMRFKGVAFTQLPPPNGYGSDAYRALVPMGTIPGFVDGDVVLSESNAIVEYLEENVPTPALLPEAPLGRAMQRSLASIHDGWVEPQIRALYPQVSRKGRDSNKVQTHCELFARRLNEFANYAHGQLADSLTFSDLAWPTTLVHARLLLPVFGFELKLPKVLEPWHERLLDEDAVKPDVAACEAGMHKWLETKLSS